MTKSNSYWESRFTQFQDAQNKNLDKYIAELQRAFSKATMALKKDLAYWYQKFAKDAGISYAEAKRLLTSGELKEFRLSVDEYIERAKTTKDAKLEKELRLASARAHIDRLQAMQLQLRQHVEEAMGMQTLQGFEYTVANTYVDTYLHTAYETQLGTNTGFDVAGVNKASLEAVLKKPWTADGMNFSDRLWKNKEALVNNLQTELAQMIIRGEGQSKVVERLAKRMDTGLSQTARLVATESAYFASEAEKKSMLDLGVEEYRIVATLDNKTSEICQGLDGKVFKMSEYKQGVTAPPFHCWCRSCTVPNVPKLGQRAARDKDGKTYYVPSSMSYEVWQNEYAEDALKVKPDYNPHSHDKEQFARYRAVLGDKVPDSVAKFSEMKAKEPKRWEEMKKQYRIVNRYDIPKGMSIDTVIELDRETAIHRKEGFDLEALRVPKGQKGKGRAEARRLQTNGNCAIMELDGKRYYTHSGSWTGREPMFEAYVGKYSFVPLSNDRTFITSTIGEMNRAECTEAKMLEFVAKKKKRTDEFTVTLMSEKCVCPSCKGVIEQFRARYPKAKLNVIAGKEERNVRGERKRAIQNDRQTGKNPS